MSRLKELQGIYAREDVCIPVEFYASNGQLVRGAVQRVHDNGMADVVTAWVDTTINTKINVSGFAGAANPGVWCLTRSAHTLYNQLGNPEVNEMSAKRIQILKLIWNVFGQYFKPRFFLIKEWPGRDTSGITGFIKLNKNTAGRCGFLVHDKEGLEPEFVENLPKVVILEEVY